MFWGALKLAAVSSLLMLNGCAISYMEDDGSRRILGFAEVEVVPAELFVRADAPTMSSKVFVGDVIVVRTIGLSFLGSEDSSAITLGYARHSSALLRNCYGGTADVFSDTCDTPANAPDKKGHTEGLGPAHHLGFVDLRIPISSDMAQVAGSYASHEALGVSLLGMANEQTISVGYADSRLSALGTKVLLLGHPDDATPKKSIKKKLTGSE